MSILDSSFNRNQNNLFKIKNLDQLFNKNYEGLQDMIQHHIDNHIPRLERLEDAYLGYNHGINNRAERDPELADYKATHDFAKYTVDFTTGYVGGNPIKYKVENENDQKHIDGFNDVNDIEAHDFNMIEDCSIYGRAYELVYRDEDGVDKVVQVSPYEAFCIRDNTREQNIIAGVIHFLDKDDDGQEQRSITVYTDSEVYELMDRDGTITLVDSYEHLHGDVQLNEWFNNRFRTGDFEHVLDLIDLYDLAQSDTANYMTDLNDAMLKIEGNVELNTEQAKKMKQSRIILAKTKPDAQGSVSPVNVDYIYKQYDVQGVESYKDRIKQDIHLLTYTPDLSDENFSGVQSGEAMKYKLTSLEQLRVKKERMYKKALNKRYRLLNNVLGIQNILEESSNKVQIEFSPNVPKTKKEMIELFMQLGGNLSERTKIQMLDFIDNVDAELNRIEDEREQAQERAPDLYDQSNEDNEEDSADNAEAQ